MRTAWLTWLIGIPVGVFGAGIVAGYAATRRGIPPEQIGGWLVKESVRCGLAAYDGLIDALPDDEPTRLSDALRAPAPEARRFAGSVRT